MVCLDPPSSVKVYGTPFPGTPLPLPLPFVVDSAVGSAESLSKCSSGWMVLVLCPLRDVAAVSDTVVKIVVIPSSAGTGIVTSTMG